MGKQRIGIIMSAMLCLGAFCMASEKGTEWIDDPSLIPAVQNETYLRIIADFNHDSINDMAISVPLSLFGNAGGEFFLYLGNGHAKYRRIGQIFCHPQAIALEYIGERVRIWTYSHGSISEGVIGYNEIMQNRLLPFQGITVFPGDDGSAMGNAIYKAVMDHSDAPWLVQQSLIQDGKVKWIKY
jgi:hypothetical protein